MKYSILIFWIFLLITPILARNVLTPPPYPMMGGTYSSASDTITGICPEGYVIQNITSLGIECVEMEIGGILNELDPLWTSNQSNYLNYSQFNSTQFNYSSNQQNLNLSWLSSYINSFGFLSSFSLSSSHLDNICNQDGKILKRIGGVWQCATDQQGMNYTKRQEGYIVYLDINIP